MSKLSKELYEFNRKYNAVVGPSSRSYHRSPPISFNIWDESNPRIYQSMHYEEIKCVEIHMPEDRFHALLEHDEWLYNSRMSNHMVGGEAIQIVKQHERETRIRHSNPSVQLAWEKYQTMLTLVDSHYD
jgi:predicted nucleotide-binding protein (sugar kinase/HSP70/actin superfamily)